MKRSADKFINEEKPEAKSRGDRGTFKVGSFSTRDIHTDSALEQGLWHPSTKSSQSLRESRLGQSYWQQYLNLKSTLTTYSPENKLILLEITGLLDQQA